jgi:Nucleotidyltransferase
MKEGAGTEPFVRFIETLEPWSSEVVLIGGWAHRLYRLDRRARELSYPPLTTLDGDVAIPSSLGGKHGSIRERLLEAGFQEEFIGDHLPPATHYHWTGSGEFYAEFLSPLRGSEFDRKGKRKATVSVAGISSQQLRYVEILLTAPWSVTLSTANGFPFLKSTKVLVANAASFLAQKLLIHAERPPRDRAKDLLYAHDTIELFSANLAELRNLYIGEIRPTIHSKRAKELREAGSAIFSKVNDTVREAVRMAIGRKLDSEAMVETCRAGMDEIFLKE